MLDEMRVNDEQLDISDLRQLESADEIAHFFAKLCYDVDERTNIPDYSVLGMGSEDMRQHIHKIELIGKDPEDGGIIIYLFEVRSVTAKLRNDIARRFRERPENAILVLTKDYDELEFVMLDRIVSRSQSRRTALKQAIRPIPLTVNRLRPDAVALRVLKRFTFTEQDAAYQWENLRSAYMLAEWSEEYFNNRALFSDYYLKERLTDLKITPQWSDDVRPVGRGEINETTMAEILSLEPSNGSLVLRGGNIQRSEFISIPRQGTLKYIDVKQYEEKYGGERIVHTRKRRIGYQRNAALDNWKRLIFAPLPCPSYCFDSVSYYLVAENESQSFAQLALLNSKLLEWRFGLSSSNNHVSTAEIAELPIPAINFITPTNERQRLTQQVIGADDIDDNLGVLQRVQSHIDADKTDVVHDLLAHLAQCMIDLNKQKQAEVKRFSSWIEKRLNIRPKDNGSTGIDALIDKIVYRLYGLTDEEIELIERPQYEQALADAKSQVVADEKIKDGEDKIEKIAEGILPAAKRFFERVEPASVEALLDRELPAWRMLPPDAPIFLITGDYNLQALPDHMDFSSSIIPYTKAVETVLYERLFAPFRDGSGYTDADCSNRFLKDFMRGDKKLTLGSFMIILSSSRETALRTFISHTIPDAANRVFGTNGLVTILQDETMRNIRNKAAHDEVLSCDEAQEARSWAMQILRQV